MSGAVHRRIRKVRAPVSRASVGANEPDEADHADRGHDEARRDDGEASAPALTDRGDGQADAAGRLVAEIEHGEGTGEHREETRDDEQAREKREGRAPILLDERAATPKRKSPSR